MRGVSPGSISVVLTYGIEHPQGYGSLTLRAAIVRLPCDEQRNGPVASTNNRDAPEVPGMQVTFAGMYGVHGQKHSPSGQANDIHAGGINPVEAEKCQ
jgi:hypothetical protein